jgi:hypothetical protein
MSVIPLKPKRVDAVEALRSFQEQLSSESLKAHEQYRQTFNRKAQRLRQRMEMLQRTVNSKRNK